MPDNHVNKAVEGLIDDGLKAYGSGQFRSAITTWERVLEIEPKNELAEEYIKLAKGSLSSAPAETEEKEGAATETPAEPQASPPTAPQKEPIPAGEEKPVHKRARKLLQEQAWPEAYVFIERAAKEDRQDKVIAGLSAIARTHLYGRYYDRIGSMTKMPKLAVSIGDIKKLDLTKEDGYILSLIDGTLNFEDIFYLSRMDKFSVLAIFCRLLEESIIEV